MMNEAASHALLENLKRQGADRFDPVRFRFLESFERRLRANGLQQGAHWQKLEQAISDYQARLEGAEQPKQAPAASEPSLVSSLLDRLSQTTEIPAKAPRSALEQRVFGETSERQQSFTAPSSNSHQPLKAMIRARADQGTHLLQERIRHALESTPKEAGPMNAHRLVSRALKEMQALSPEYLERFARYTDTLLALERLTKRGLEKNL
ncbi:DUF2894 domain-containing protein [Marinobacter shengliensis]|uniref:DUF2894 domain-containing protein n=1 Tax=Marinobacter shengliensis TaxID=1389223 RepID=UPI001D18B469|nr:DUF2894 domain-containing protein [Marinobacter shengliensis]